MDKKRLRIIYNKTNGYCHICHKKLSFTNHARYSSKGAWEIDHSKPKTKGGSDRVNNLFSACVSCNRSKSAKSTAIARRKYGNTRAPYCKAKKQQIKRQKTTAKAVIGGLVGSVFGLGGMIIGAGIGAVVNEDSSPKKVNVKKKADTIIPGLFT